jgi:hypothetical protein
MDWRGLVMNHVTMHWTTGLARTGVKDLWIFLMSCFGRDIGRKYSIGSKY